MDSSNSGQTNQQEEQIKFCPICGSQMVEEVRYGIDCWVCPECDFVDPV
ncbi:TPA: zf-TFIIB domain-containing protein [Citrobacter freundii]